MYSSTYRYDKTAARTRIIESRGGAVVRTSIYTYDATDKLLSESDGTTSIVYTYDDVDNRISKTVNGTATTYSVDKLNRVLSSTTGGVVDATFTYDTNGNRASKTVGTATQTYSYDRENRLVAVSDGTSNIFTASYDYRTRRMSTLDESATKQYVYDAGDCVQERDSSGSLTKQLVRGTGLGGGIGSVLYSDSGSTTTPAREYFLYNVIGSTVVTTNADASVKSTNLYEAFGKVIATTGSSDNNRLFCTKERSESIGLDNFGHRYFDWDIGRFVTRDPAGYPDGLNNYLYCSNNPINRIDPLGLKKIEDYKKDIEKEAKAKKAEQDAYLKESRKKSGYEHLAGKEREEYLAKEKAELGKMGKKYDDAMAAAEKAIDKIKVIAKLYNMANDLQYEELKKKYGDNIPQEEINKLFKLDANKLDDESEFFGKLEKGSSSLVYNMFAGSVVDPVRDAAVLGEVGSAYIAGAVAGATAKNLASTGRTVAKNLKEQLAMEAAKANPTKGEVLSLTMKDSRWPATKGWVKMEQKINGIIVHYVRNIKTGEVADFKFK